MELQTEASSRTPTMTKTKPPDYESADNCPIAKAVKNATDYGPGPVLRGCSRAASTKPRFSENDEHPFPYRR